MVTLSIHLNKIKENARIMRDYLASQQINTTFVVKAVHGDMQVVSALYDAGIYTMASSRLDQLKRMKKAFPNLETHYIRVPALSELDQVVQVVDVCMVSELKTLAMLNQKAADYNKRQKVMLMKDLGDLREGIFDTTDFLGVVKTIESQFENLNLVGIGTNLSCYGSVMPTNANMTELVDLSKQVEAIIQRPLRMVSGGNTLTLPLLLKGDCPQGINHLRIGEGFLLGRDLTQFFGANIEGIVSDAFELEAEVIEVMSKPTYPIGELYINGFGEKPHYEDRGIKRRALLNIGNQDVGNFEKLIPIDQSIRVVGASSDYLIVEGENLRLGGKVSFYLDYQALLFAYGEASIERNYHL